MPDALDQLLDEYKEETKPAAPTAPIQPLIEAMRPVAEFARRKMAEEIQTDVAKGVAEAVAGVKKIEGLDKAPDRIVTGLLHAAYADDPAFREAYDNRAKNPSALSVKLAEIGAALSEDMKGLSVSDARSDVEAAKAAVKGSGGAPPVKQGTTPMEMAEMSDTQFRDYKRKQTAVH